MSTVGTNTLAEPRKNLDGFGFEEIEARLLAAFAQGKAPPGMLFSGAQGIGKATFAFRLARFFLYHKERVFDKQETLALPLADDDPQTALRASGVARRVASGGHGDLFVLERGLNKEKEKAKSITVDDVRRATQFLKKTPFEGGWRIVIVDTADDLNKNAANALLKALEEPPSRSLVILVAERPDQLPATVLSRCHKFVMQAPPLAVCDRILETQIPDLAERQLLLRLAEGSPGLAWRYHEMKGKALYEAVLSFLKLVVQHQGNRAILPLQRHLGAEGEGFDIWLRLLHGVLPRMLRGTFSPPADTLSVVAAHPLEQEVFQLMQRHPISLWLQRWQQMDAFLTQAAIYHLDWRQVVEGIVYILEGRHL